MVLASHVSITYVKKKNNRCPLLLPECLPQQVTVFLMGIIEAMEILP
jgi:hypothetical protein